MTLDSRSEGMPISGRRKVSGLEKGGILWGRGRGVPRGRVGVSDFGKGREERGALEEIPVEEVGAQDGASGIIDVKQKLGEGVHEPKSTPESAPTIEPTSKSLLKPKSPSIPAQAPMEVKSRPTMDEFLRVMNQYMAWKEAYKGKRIGMDEYLAKQSRWLAVKDAYEKGTPLGGKFDIGYPTLGESTPSWTDTQMAEYNAWVESRVASGQGFPEFSSQEGVVRHTDIPTIGEYYAHVGKEKGEPELELASVPPVGRGGKDGVLGERKSRGIPGDDIGAVRKRTEEEKARRFFERVERAPQGWQKGSPWDEFNRSRVLVDGKYKTLGYLWKGEEKGWKWGWINPSTGRYETGYLALEDAPSYWRSFVLENAPAFRSRSSPTGGVRGGLRDSMPAWKQGVRRQGRFGSLFPRRTYPEPRRGSRRLVGRHPWRRKKSSGRGLVRLR